MEIAFIGLGAMGLPMAKRLIKAEHGLHIIKHRNPLPVEELAGMGATVHEHTADAVQACDMIISILPSDKEMESVLLEESVLESAKPGALLLEMTSGSPQMMKKKLQKPIWTKEFAFWTLRSAEGRPAPSKGRLPS